MCLVNYFKKGCIINVYVHNERLYLLFCFKCKVLFDLILLQCLYNMTNFFPATLWKMVAQFEKLSSIFETIKGILFYNKR